MITFQKAYVCSDTNVYATLELAQEHELELLLNAEKGTEPLTIIRVAQLIVLLKTKILDVLSTTAKSRPRARSLNGGKKQRKSKDVVPAKAPETAKAI